MKFNNVKFVRNVAIACTTVAMLLVGCNGAEVITPPAPEPEPTPDPDPTPGDEASAGATTEQYERGEVVDPGWN